MKSGGDKSSDQRSAGGVGGGNVFDLGQLRRLIKLMEAHDLTEINLKQGSEKVQLRRGGVAPQPVAMQPPPAPVAAAPPAPAAPATPAASVEDGPNIVTIKSPMVGTFYGRPNPDAEPFVKVGQRISADTVICIVEAMKVFNEIPAEVSGQVVAVLADDQQAVDFGRPLFKIDTSA